VRYEWLLAEVWNSGSTFHLFPRWQRNMTFTRISLKIIGPFISEARFNTLTDCDMGYNANAAAG